MTIFSQIISTRSVLRQLRRGRAFIVMAAALVSLLVATVAIGQASQNFDLACRGMLTAGGLVSTSGNYAVIGAMGSPIIPPTDSSTPRTYAVRSNSFAVRAGFLSAYPNDVSAADTATIQQSPPAGIEQGGFLQHLPLLAKAGQIIRGTCK